MNQTPLSPGTRLGSMLLDHVFMTIVMIIFLLPISLSQVPVTDAPTQEQVMKALLAGNHRYLVVLAAALYLWKDSFGGRSLAKRILKLQVVDMETGLPASPLQTVIRNITIIVWFIEVPLALFNPERRIGDRLAGTRLVPYDETIPVPSLNPLLILLSLILAYGLMFVILIPLNSPA